MTLFNELVARLTPKLMAMAKQLDGQYACIDDDDLYQEALIHLWKKEQAGELQDKTDSYILQSCYFHMKHATQYADRKGENKSLDEVIGEDGEGNSITLGDTIAGKDLPESAVLQIPIKSDRDRKVLGLLLDGYTTREIGEKVGVSAMMVSKIRKKLQGMVYKMGAF